MSQEEVPVAVTNLLGFGMRFGCVGWFILSWIATIGFWVMTAELGKLKKAFGINRAVQQSGSYKELKDAIRMTLRNKRWYLRMFGFVSWSTTVVFIILAVSAGWYWCATLYILASVFTVIWWLTLKEATIQAVESITREELVRLESGNSTIPQTPETPTEVSDPAEEIPQVPEVPPSPRPRGVRDILFRD